MSGEVAKTLKSIALEYDNIDVKVVAKEACPEMDIAGTKVCFAEPGREIDLKNWIAKELATSGLVKFSEDDYLTPVGLYKIHWRETIQGGMQISQLPEYFYPKLRRLLSELKEQGRDDIAKVQEHQRAIHLSQDIITCRLKKIINLASAPAQTNNILGNLTKEEQVLYKVFKNVIDEWRTNLVSP